MASRGAVSWQTPSLEWLRNRNPFGKVLKWLVSHCEVIFSLAALCLYPAQVLGGTAWFPEVLCWYFSIQVETTGCPASLIWE